jgi:hypothetical protein
LSWPFAFDKFPLDKWAGVVLVFVFTDVFNPGFFESRDNCGMVVRRSGGTWRLGVSKGIDSISRIRSWVH